MELIVGTNSYMTLEEANDIVNKYFDEDDAEYVYWFGLKESKRTKLIYSVTEDVNNTCLFKGHFVTREQALPFPRCIDRQVVECPEDIKTAIILQILKDGVLKQSDEIKMQELGVKSFADGTGASVSFGDNKELTKVGSIYTDIYDKYLRKWSICI